MKRINLESNHKLYESFIWLYELMFKPFFIGAIKKAMKTIEKFSPENIVEIGVGTGYSLEHYPSDTNIIGLDISDKMVHRSRQRAMKIENKNINIYNIVDCPKDNIQNYASMVVSFSVMTVVSNPQKLINDLKSCCKSGGHIMIIMHCRGKGLSRLFDKLLDLPMKLLFGFTLLRHISDYNLDGLEIIEISPASFFLFYPYNHLVLLKKNNLS